MKTLVAGAVILFGLFFAAMLVRDGALPSEVFASLVSGAVMAAVAFAFEERRVDKVRREVRRRDENQ